MDPSQPIRPRRAAPSRGVRTSSISDMRRDARRWAAAFGLGAVLGVAGCAAGPPEAIPTEQALPIEASKEEIEARQEALRAAIDADHARLETLVREPQTDGPEGLNRNPELRTLADGLERKRAELRRLDARRSSVDR